MPNKFSTLRPMTVLCVALTLGACSSTTARTDIADDALPPCTAKGTPFENVEPFVWSDATKNWSTLQWSEPYHDRVSAVIEEYRTAIGIGAAQNLDEQPPDTVLLCTEEDYPNVVPAGPKLKELAETLLPWQRKDVTTLSATSAGPVLMEQLREYQCAIDEYKRLMREKMATTMRAMNDARQKAGKSPLFGTDDIVNETARRTELMDAEARVAKTSLERTLTLLSGTQRLHPLVADIDCMLRASLDLRNAFALLSGAASCAGRAADARSPLRF